MNDHHALGEGTGYIIMKVLPQQMGARLCVAVLALPHLTPQLHGNQWESVRTIQNHGEPLRIIQNN